MRARLSSNKQYEQCKDIRIRCKQHYANARIGFQSSILLKLPWNTEAGGRNSCYRDEFRFIQAPLIVQAIFHDIYESLLTVRQFRSPNNRRTRHRT